MGDIATWRGKIDEIDKQLVKLLNERAAFAIEIGKIKHDTGLEIYNPEREKQIKIRLNELNNGPLDNETVVRLFGKIIEACRESEKM